MPASTPVKESETTVAQKPLKTFRLRGVSASVFANSAKVDGKERTFHKVAIQRAYKDGEDWKHTSSFGRDDLPVLKKLVDDAWNHILATEAAAKNADDAE